MACEISAEGGAYYLFSLDAAGRSFADTWHQSVAEAKTQASFQFGVQDADWQPVHDDT